MTTRSFSPIEDVCDQIGQLDSSVPVGAIEVDGIDEVIQRDVESETSSDRATGSLHRMDQIKRVLFLFVVLICHQ